MQQNGTRMKKKKEQKKKTKNEKKKTNIEPTLNLLKFS